MTRWMLVVGLLMGGVVRAQAGYSVVGVAESSDDGHVAANTLDGDISTRWSAYGEGEWIQWDLGQAVPLSSVKIAFYKGYGRVASFDLLVSDGSGDVARAFVGLHSSGKTSKLQTFNFGHQLSARYIQYVGHGNNINPWNSLTEFKAPPPSITATTVSSTTTTTLTGSATFPSQVLDLQNWKLTLPIDANGDGKADEIVQPQLASFILVPPFSVSDDGTGVVFWANCGGATTSGSGYPRSELREMNGGTVAAWGTADGHVHTMTLREAITHVPDVKREVVAGQIHDSRDDVIEIRYSQDYKVPGRNYLFVEASESGTSRDLGALDDHYVLGMPFELKIEAANGMITVWYNGLLKVSYPRTSTGDYFKAGVYPQSNTSKGDLPSAYGEVVIHDLVVTHE